MLQSRKKIKAFKHVGGPLSHSHRIVLGNNTKDCSTFGIVIIVSLESKCNATNEQGRVLKVTHTIEREVPDIARLA